MRRRCIKPNIDYTLREKQYKKDVESSVMKFEESVEDKLREFLIATGLSRESVANMESFRNLVAHLNPGLAQTVGKDSDNTEGRDTVKKEMDATEQSSTSDFAMGQGSTKVKIEEDQVPNVVVKEEIEEDAAEWAHTNTGFVADLKIVPGLSRIGLDGQPEPGFSNDTGKMQFDHEYLAFSTVADKPIKEEVDEVAAEVGLNGSGLVVPKSVGDLLVNIPTKNEIDDEMENNQAVFTNGAEVKTEPVEEPEPAPRPTPPIRINTIPIMLTEDEKEALRKKLLSIRATKRRPTVPGLKLVPCIICKHAIACYQAVLLSVNEAVKYLMTAVVGGFMTINQAKETILTHPLRMCRDHYDFMYKSMIYAVGADDGDGVDRAPCGHIMRCLVVYRQLKKLCERKKKIYKGRTPISSFKLALKASFRNYLPRRMAKTLQLASPVKKYKRKMEQITPNTPLHNFLLSQNVHLDEKEQMHLLDALKMPERRSRKRERRWGVENNDVQASVDVIEAVNSESNNSAAENVWVPPLEDVPSTSSNVPTAHFQRAPSPVDPTYNYHMQRYKREREQRYEIYPEEFQKIMAPIDQGYDLRAAKSRKEIRNIRGRKEEEKSITPPPKPYQKQRRAYNFAQLAQQAMQETNYDDPVLCNAPSTSQEPIVSASNFNMSLSQPNVKVPDQRKYRRVVPAPESKTPYQKPASIRRPHGNVHPIQEPQRLSPLEVEPEVPDWIRKLPIIEQPTFLGNLQHDTSLKDHLMDGVKLKQNAERRPQQVAVKEELSFLNQNIKNEDFSHIGQKPVIGSQSMEKVPKKKGYANLVTLKHQPHTVRDESLSDEEEQIDYGHNIWKTSSIRNYTPEPPQFPPEPVKGKLEMDAMTMLARRLEKNRALHQARQSSPKEYKPILPQTTEDERHQQDLRLNLKSQPVRELQMRPASLVPNKQRKYKPILPPTTMEEKRHKQNLTLHLKPQPVQELNLRPAPLVSNMQQEYKPILPPRTVEDRRQQKNLTLNLKSQPVQELNMRPTQPVPNLQRDDSTSTLEREEFEDYHSDMSLKDMVKERMKKSRRLT